MAVKRIPGISVQVKTACEALNKLTGKVGWFETAVYPDGTPVAYVATIHEFGKPEQGIKARSFMRPTASEKAQEWKGHLIKGANAALVGKISARQAMEMISQAAAGDVRKTISNITSPPLKPETVKARLRGKKQGKVVSITAAKPLVDTGLMLQTLTAVVEDQ